MSDSAPIRSNVAQWKELQDRDYFENHPVYNGFDLPAGPIVANIEKLISLKSHMKAAIIGCGYGRDSLEIAPKVGQVFGIDVSEYVLAKASKFLASNGVENFTPVVYDQYKSDIPEGIDLVFSVVVMQHLTRDLVVDYFRSLSLKMAPGGSFVVQFLEETFDGVELNDAELVVYEPSVSWTVRQLVDLTNTTGLEFQEVRSVLATPTAVWHWLHAKKSQHS